MNKKRKAIIEGNEISEIVTLSLGGHDQRVLIEGKSKNLPVIIILHGGPGAPLPMGMGCRGLFPEYTNQFIVVYWDQWGCGANNAVIDESFCIREYADMTIDLVLEMKKRFPDNKTILLGTSWGSIPCLQAVVRMGKQIDAAVVWGQIVKNPICNQNAFHTIEQKKMKTKDREKLQNIKKQPITLDSIKFTAGCIRKYTDGYNNHLDEKMPMGAMAWGILTSPDYRMKDIKAIMINGSTKNHSIWNEINRTDLSDLLKKVEIPYHILQGDTDIVTDTDTVVKQVELAQNSHLSCSVIQKSGHMPGATGMHAVLEALICQK